MLTNQDFEDKVEISIEKRGSFTIIDIEDFLNIFNISNSFYLFISENTGEVKLDKLDDVKGQINNFLYNHDNFMLMGFTKDITDISLLFFPFYRNTCMKVYVDVDDFKKNQDDIISRIDQFFIKQQALYCTINEALLAFSSGFDLRINISRQLVDKDKLIFSRTMDNKEYKFETNRQEFLETAQQTRIIEEIFYEDYLFHSHYDKERGLWFGLAWMMWFSKEYENYYSGIRNDKKDLYSNVILNDEVNRITLFKEMDGYMNNQNLLKAANFRERYKIDEISHNLLNIPYPLQSAARTLDEIAKKDDEFRDKYDKYVKKSQKGSYLGIISVVVIIIAIIIYNVLK